MENINNKKNSRCVIVAGAKINNMDFVKSYLRKDDYFIFCDGALNKVQLLGYDPDLIVGDFDSYNKDNKNKLFSNIESIELPTEKDDTDSVFAIKEAVKRGFKDFLIIGSIGQRLDHTLGNIAILAYLDSLKLNAVMVDDYSEISIVSDKTSFIDDSCRYFSLLNVFGEASGINIKNAKYPLSDAVITCDYQYGISNEVLPGLEAEVSVDNGRLLLIKIMDINC